MANPLFSILLITYNRPDMLRECLRALQDQTLGEYEVYVLDRGSVPSVEPFVAELADERFHYIASSQHIHLVDGSNAVISRMRGAYFFHIADDDLITKDTLELVHLAFKKESHCNVVQAGLVGYDFYLETDRIDAKHFSRHSNQDYFDESGPRIRVLDGKESVLFEWAQMHIGPARAMPQPRLHPTSLFFRMVALQPLWETQQGFFLKPIWDLGTLPVVFQSQVLHLNIPLAIVSENHVARESLCNRERWQVEMATLQYLPLRIPCLLSCFTETALKSIHANRLESQVQPFLNPSFFNALLAEVLKDNPFTFATLRDVICLLRFTSLTPYLCEKLTPFLSFKAFERRMLRPMLAPLKKRFSRVRQGAKEPITPLPFKKFETITSYRHWLEHRFAAEVAQVKGGLTTHEHPA
jgi:hypothetical protein